MDKHGLWNTSIVYQPLSLKLISKKKVLSQFANKYSNRIASYYEIMLNHVDNLPIPLFLKDELMEAFNKYKNMYPSIQFTPWCHCKYCKF